MTNIDTNSIVLLDEASAPTSDIKSTPTQTITNPIDYNSIKFEEDKSPTDTQISASPPKPTVWQNISTLFKGTEDHIPSGKRFADLSNEEQLAAVTQSAFDKQHAVENILRESPSVSNAKAQNIYAISEMTGVPKEDISKHYDDIKFLSSVSGIEPGMPSNEELASAFMTTAIAPAFVANPVATVGGLISFGILDKLVPTEKFIPEGASKGAKDSIKLIGLLVKGGIVGGLFDALPKTTKAFPSLDSFVEHPSESVGRTKDNAVEIFKKWTQKKLEEKGLPDVIEVTPEQIAKIQQIDTPTPITPEEVLAEQKRSEKGNKRKENIISDLENKIYNREALPEQNYPQEWLAEAQKRVLDRINNMEKEQGKIENRFQDMRYKLNQALKEPIDQISARIAEKPATLIEKLGIDQQTAETAKTNNLNVKIASENLVDVALSSEEHFKKVEEALSETKAIEGTGDTKKRGLSQGVEAKAVENKLTKGFGDLPEYKVLNMEDQAKKATELLNSDYEQALRIAMGEEKAPPEITPEALFVAVENKAIAEGDVATLRDLATKSKLSTEATTMGQRIRTLAERDSESPIGAIKDVMAEREARAKKRLKGKETIENKVEEVTSEIKKEMKKVKHTKQSWADFIDQIKC